MNGCTVEGPTEQRDERNLRARARSAAAKIGLALGAVLATLIFVELVLSALFEPILKVWQVREIFQLDEELIYSLKPGQERIAESEEFVEHVTTNRHGLRDDEIRTRDSFEKRIIVLGDSMIFGHGVNDDQTFPNQLEAIYRNEHRAVDVINAGVKGYGTDSAYKFFTARLQPLSLQPDLVIFSIYHNDLYDNIGQPLYTIENGSLAPLDPTRNWIYLLGTIEQKTPDFIRNRILYGIVLSRFVGRDIYSVLPDKNRQELYEWAAHKAFLEIADLRRRGRRQGFRVMVLCVPYRDGPANAYAWLEPLRKLGIWLFDPSQDPVWKAEKERWFFGKDYHMTPAGNRLFAERVHEAIAREEF
jgi:lysophospholipase L1-like esterase